MNKMQETKKLEETTEKECPFRASCTSKKSDFCKENFKGNFYLCGIYHSITLSYVRR